MIPIIYPLRLTIGVGLAVVAAIFLVLNKNAHVTMCMIGAIGYGVGLSIPRRELASRIASVFFSWTAFYTVYTATTFLAIEGAVGNTGLFDNPAVTRDQGWIYHTIINFVLLLLFVSRLDRMPNVLAGFWSAMLAAPFMFVLALLGRELWEIESPTMIVGYAIGGLVLLGLDIFLKRKSIYIQLLRFIRIAIIVSLVGYAAITLAPYALGIIGVKQISVENLSSIQSQKSIGYAGCSITIQTVEGYRELGGQDMWPPDQGFDDGSVFNWNNPQGRWRDAFNKNAAMYPETKIIWWQLCVPVHEAKHLTYAHVESTVDFFKTRLPEATIYVSSLAPYRHLCEGSGTTGVSTGQRLAEELVSKRSDVKLGPIFSTLTIAETENDLCHLNESGKEKMGQELKKFYEHR